MKNEHLDGKQKSQYKNNRHVKNSWHMFLTFKLTAFFNAFKDCVSLMRSTAPVTKKLVRYAVPRLSANRR